MNQEYDDGGHPCDDEQLFCTQNAAQALMDMKPTLTNINRVAMRNVGCLISMGIEGEEKDNPIIFQDDADENIAPNSRRVSLSVTKKPPKFCRPISNPYIKKGTPRLAISTPASNFLPNETSPSLTGTTGSFALATALNRASASAHSNCSNCTYQCLSFSFRMSACTYVCPHYYVPPKTHFLRRYYNSCSVNDVERGNSNFTLELRS